MRNELTRKDIEDMEKEIEYRKLVVRPKALDDVKEARALGDLSENFEYHAAKKFKNENESRIRYRERMVKTAVVIDDGSTSAEDEVSINKTVTVYVPEDDVEEKYTLVSTVRTDTLNNLISIESPLGKALVGHKVGDTVTIEVSRDYQYNVVIRAVEDAKDAADAAIRAY